MKYDRLYQGLKHYNFMHCKNTTFEIKIEGHENAINLMVGTTLIRKVTQSVRAPALHTYGEWEICCFVIKYKT